MPPLFQPDEVLPLGDTIDVRSPSDFRIGHFGSAVSIPLADLDAHLHLLPARSERLWVYGDDEEIEPALSILRERGFASVASHPAVSSFASPKEAIHSSWVGGPERVRLWRPSPFLARVWPRLAETWAAPTPGVAPRALDLACGSGRDAVWLALGGCRVVGVDALPDALTLAVSRASAAARAVVARDHPAGERLHAPAWLVADLESSLPLVEGRFDLVVVVRFLHRPLLTALPRLLRRGGSLVYSTFTWQQAEWGRPTRPAHLLESGELRSFAESAGLAVREYEESNPQGGPALASLWAERPAPMPRH